jgi:prevent-host-death family protein
MKPISVSEARDQLSEVIGRVQFGHERITLERRGKPVAVIVTVEDAAALEKLEDHFDLMDVLEAKAEMAREGGRTYSLEEVLAELEEEEK